MSIDILANEAAFVEHTLPFLRHWLPEETSELRVAREVGVGRSIADIVMLSVTTPDRCLINHSPLRQPLSVHESVVLSSLRNYGATRIDLLEKRCGIEHYGLRKGALDRLIKFGLVRRQRGGRVNVDSNRWNNASSIIAIEAKLSRWHDALEQARRYQQYANYSYVLLPEVYAAPAIAAKATFIESTVGLLVADSARVTTIVEAPRVNSHNWRREFVLSRLISAEKYVDAE